MPEDSHVMNVCGNENRRLDRILDAAYLQKISESPLESLREKRDEAAQEETDLSYLRRLLHARIDIVRAEQRRRDSAEQEELVGQLAEILAENALGRSHSSRHQLAPSQAGEYQRQAENLINESDLTDVGNLTDDELAQALVRYQRDEADISGRRRAVQNVVDTVNAEIAGRYAKGSATVDELLAHERGEK